MKETTTQTEIVNDGERQLVAMRVDDEMFGIDIAYINTVITPQPITSVPQTPAFVRGVMNLRGRILPVLDLRSRFGLSPMTPEAEAQSRIVIVEVGEYSAGLVVDEVSEVLRIPNAAIEPPSSLVQAIDKDMIVGIGRTTLSRRGMPPTEGFILLLDVKHVLTQGLMETQFATEGIAA